MIPESELQRIQVEAENYAFQVPFNGTNIFYNETKYDAFIAGASAEHERAQAIKDENYENDYIIGFFLGFIKSDEYEFALFEIDNFNRLQCILSKESMDKLRSAKRWSIVKLKGISFDCKYLEIDYKEGDTSLLIDTKS